MGVVGLHLLGNRSSGAVTLGAGCHYCCGRWNGSNLLGNDSRGAITAASRRSGGGGSGENKEGVRRFADLVLRGSLGPPQYGKGYSRDASKLMYHGYIEYRDAVTKTNRWQSVKRYVLTLSEVIPKHVRACLSRNVFEGSELSNDNLLEALAKHAECWKEEEIDAAVAVAGPKRRRWTV